MCTAVPPLLGAVRALGIGSASCRGWGCSGMRFGAGVIAKEVYSCSVECPDIFFETHFSFFSFTLISLTSLSFVKVYLKLEIVSTIHSQNSVTLCLFWLWMVQCIAILVFLLLMVYM